MASACLLGGPRRRLGRLKVHGISRAVQDLHGGPLSSHYVVVSYAVHVQSLELSLTLTFRTLQLSQALRNRGFTSPVPLDLLAD